jgi:ABC-type lipoprotein export system ATPase subunit
MSKSIEIKKLRHISNLKFEIPGPGVYLLSGRNGAGKTSLLACLHRINSSQAFPRHFRSSSSSAGLDDFNGSEITYTLNNSSVTYAYAGERWVPRPRAKGKLLKSFGYPEVVYIGATADRITPRSEDFAIKRLRSASPDIREPANQIFSTNKFDQLKVINLKPGSGNQAFLLQATPAPGATYYSERNFSLGELCVLKLLRRLKDCKKGSMVLIDELELALHPKAQIALLQHLRSIAPVKDLTVVFSTHSISLLKSVPRDNILFMEHSVSSGSTVIRGCYPAYAMGNMAFDEERAPDAVIYVEDYAAVYATEALLQLHLHSKHGDDPTLRPTVLVLPIGSFINVVRHLANSDALLPKTTRTHALLDEDVKTENVKGWESSSNHVMLAEFSLHKKRISYLPWTPEVGMVNYFRLGGDIAERALKQNFKNPLLTIRTSDIGVIPPNAGGEQRRACKTAVLNVTRQFASLMPTLNEAEILRRMYAVFASSYFSTNQPAVMNLFGALVL